MKIAKTFDQIKINQGYQLVEYIVGITVLIVIALITINYKKYDKNKRRKMLPKNLLSKETFELLENIEQENKNPRK